MAAVDPFSVEELRRVCTMMQLSASEIKDDVLQFFVAEVKAGMVEAAEKKTLERKSHDDAKVAARLHIVDEHRIHPT